jgi:RHS repeat-associated protein
MVNRYGYNAGNEYEDEGELNYSNTFYRKYDAQIGRFTGVDMLAEDYAIINPYQFAFNNPVIFNDPSGAMTQTEFTNAVNILMESKHGGTYSSGSGLAYLFGSQEMAFGFGAAYMDRYNLWGSQPGWASSFGEASERFARLKAESGGTYLGNRMYNYTNPSFSGIISYMKYGKVDEINPNTGEANYKYAGYCDPRDFEAIQFGYAMSNKTVGEQVLEATHVTLDLVGFLPGFGEIADGINGVIYTIQGDKVNAGLSYGAMIPFAGWGATGAKFALKEVKQVHHLIPNQIFKENKAFLKEMGWVQSHSKNLMNLPVPFHGNHPSYNKYMREKMESILGNGGGNVQSMINLQNAMRKDIQNILNSGFNGNLNDYYKALGY